MSTLPDPVLYQYHLAIVLQTIGGAGEMAHWATAGLAARLRCTGKQVHELTVGELVSAIEAQAQMHREAFG